MLKNSSTLAVSVPINIYIKLGCAPVNSHREIYFVDTLRRCVHLMLWVFPSLSTIYNLQQALIITDRKYRAVYTYEILNSTRRQADPTSAFVVPGGPGLLAVAPYSQPFLSLSPPSLSPFLSLPLSLDRCRQKGGPHSSPDLTVHDNHKNHSLLAPMASEIDSPKTRILFVSHIWINMSHINIVL